MTRVLLIALLAILVVRALSRLVFGIVEGASSTRDSGRRGGLRRGEMMERDPVCGTYVVPSRALTSGSGEGVQYFCSEECRRRFATR